MSRLLSTGIPRCWHRHLLRTTAPEISPLPSERGAAAARAEPDPLLGRRDRSLRATRGPCAQRRELLLSSEEIQRAPADTPESGRS